MSAFVEKQIEKHRRRYLDAADAMQAAVTEASIRAAVQVIAVETGAMSEQAVRHEVRAQGIMRRVLETSGHLVASLARSTLLDPLAPEAFDAAVYSVGKLLATAWQTRGGAR